MPGRSREQPDAPSGETDARQLFAERPQPCGEHRIGRPWPHTCPGFPGSVLAGDIAVLAIHTAFAIKLRADGAPDDGRGALLHGLGAADWIDDQAPLRVID